MKGRNARAAERADRKRSEMLEDMRRTAARAEDRAEGFLRVIRRVQAIAGVEDTGSIHDLPEQVGRAMGLDEDEIEERIVTAWRSQNPQPEEEGEQIRHE